MILVKIGTLSTNILSFCPSSVMMVHGAFVDPPQEKTALRSFSDSQTRLPCRYQVESEEKVVQVTWYKELPDGTKDQMITAHFTDGHTGRKTHSQRHTGRITHSQRHTGRSFVESRL